MNKRYEEGREPFFSESGEKMRKQYVWTKDKKDKKYYRKLHQSTSNRKLKVMRMNVISKTSSEKQVLTRSF